MNRTIVDPKTGINTIVINPSIVALFSLVGLFSSEGLFNSSKTEANLLISNKFLIPDEIFLVILGSLFIIGIFDTLTSGYSIRRYMSKYILLACLIILSSDSIIGTIFLAFSIGGIGKAVSYKIFARKTFREIWKGLIGFFLGVLSIFFCFLLIADKVAPSELEPELMKLIFSIINWSQFF